MPRSLDIVGRRFGRLVVLSRVGIDSRRNTRWLCRCDCGTEHVTLGYRLMNGGTTSCGCMKKLVSSIVNATHGHARHSDGQQLSPTYVTWYGMLARTRRRTGKDAINYRMRGIRACARWLVFESFLADMGARPNGMTIDRIDNDAGYDCGHCDDCRARGITKTNCRWATKSEQRKNQRPRRMCA
jgi:hypothetical protein